MKKVILFIDDDPNAAKLFRMFALDELYADVIIFSDARTALDVPADVVILDLHLPPNQDAQDTIAMIHSFKCPVIAISAVKDDRLSESAIASGAVAFYEKLHVIHHPEELQNKIKEVWGDFLMPQ